MQVSGLCSFSTKIDKFCAEFNNSYGCSIKFSSNCTDLRELKVIFLADKHLHKGTAKRNSALFDLLGEKGFFLVEGVDQDQSKELSENQRARLARVIDIKAIEAKGFSIKGWDTVDLLDSEDSGLYLVNMHFLSLIAKDFLQSLQDGNFSEEAFRSKIIERRCNISAKDNILKAYEAHLNEWVQALQKNDPFDPEQCTIEVQKAYLIFMHLKSLSEAIYTAYRAYILRTAKQRNIGMAKKIPGVASLPDAKQIFVHGGRNHFLTKTAPPKLDPVLEEMISSEKLNYCVFYQEDAVLASQDEELTSFDFAVEKNSLGRTNIDTLSSLDKALGDLERYFDAFKKDT